MNEGERKKLEVVCEDVEDIKDGLATVYDEQEKQGRYVNQILTNHLPHIESKINIVMWVVGIGLACIGIIIGLTRLA